MSVKTLAIGYSLQWETLEMVMSGL